MSWRPPPAPARTSTWSHAALAAAISVACAQPIGPPPPTSPLDSTSPPARRVISAVEAAYYRQGLPHAAAFVRKAIPAIFVDPTDADNTTYVVAYNAAHERIGYLRDVVGPVSSSEACACSPLQITLVFAANGELLDVLSPAPLQKYAHQPLTAAEHKQLLHIAQDPAIALMAAGTPEDILDGKTGATRKELRPHVVPMAALTTHRIAHLVRATRNILQNAQTSRDRVRIQAALTQASEPGQRATVLATLLPTLEDGAIRQRVYRAMVDAYTEALTDKGSRDDRVEATLVRPPVVGLAQEVARACQALADHHLLPPLVATCAGIVATNPSIPTQARDRLTGTALFLAGDLAAARAPLTRAARAYPLDEDPVLHLRLAQVLSIHGGQHEACAAAKEIYEAYPLLPGAVAMLTSCQRAGQPLAEVVADLNRAQRARLLSSKRQDALPAPILEVVDSRGEATQLKLGRRGMVTIFVVFATWCRHCRRELPHLVALVETIDREPDLKDRVRVVGLRTAIERETEPYPAFVAAIRPNFPIKTDATMSLAFARFARTYGIETALPTIAVLDDAGVARYVVSYRAHRDLAQDLRWAVADVLAGMSR